MKRMLRMRRLMAAAPVLLLAWAAPAAAQPFETLGTRAAGLGGAFVAVADDASAVYWNPGGFASGSYFSLIMDRAGAKTAPATESRAGSRSGWLLALGTPALGLSYYRLRTTTLAPVTTGAALASRDLGGLAVRVNSLITHYTGATLVQSVFPGVAVGTTLKLVRGIASSTVQPYEDRDALLDDASGLVGRASNRFDADVGVMATAARLRAGLTIRNLTQPSFDAAGDGGRLALERQARAGVAVMPVAGWLAAADVDLLRTTGPLGPERAVAVGTEGRIARRVIVRGGFRLNTVSTGATGHQPSASAGGSYAITARVLVDGQITTGSDRTARGWGVSGRFVY